MSLSDKLESLAAKDTSSKTLGAIADLLSRNKIEIDEIGGFKCCLLLSDPATILSCLAQRLDLIA